MTHPKPPAPRHAGWLPWALLAVVIGGVWWWRTADGGPRPRDVDYSTAYAWIDAGAVRSVAIDGRDVEGTLATAQTVDGRTLTTFRTRIPERDDALIPLLRARCTRIRIAAGSRSVGSHRGWWRTTA